LEDIYIKLNDNNKLEEIYLILIKIFKDADLANILNIYIKLSLLYIEMEKYDNSKEILYEAKNLKPSFKK